MKWWRSRISIAPPICLPRSRAGWNQTPTSSLVNRALCDRKETGPRQTARGPELVRSYDNLRLQLHSEIALQPCHEHAVDGEQVTGTTAACGCCTGRLGLRVPTLRHDTDAVRAVAEVVDLIVPVDIRRRARNELAIPH